LRKQFGKLAAIDNLHLSVEEGEIRGLIGPNGSGKSTFFNVCSGFLSPSKGKVLFKGEDITGLQPHAIAQKGLIRSFQQAIIWPDFTVMDTMRLALHMKSEVNPFETVLNTQSNRRKETQVDELAMELLKLMGMDQLKNQPARTLSHGYQRTLSFGIGAATRPPLLLLDEPVTALSPERRNKILDLVKQVRDTGSTVILIEHDMGAIFNICDRITVMNYGTKIAEGTPSEIRNNPVVISAYLGTKSNVT
jgi:branched-chain amino acid transport system ATP-binding protein